MMKYIPKKRNSISQYPYPLDNPPLFHQKLLDFGERPYWSPDGKRIAFVESNYGDICEIDIKTREIKNLTGNLGENHSFLRVLYLPNGDYILVGPAEFKDRFTSRRVESEIWWMDKNAQNPPVPLGRRIFEGLGVSRIANKITYAVSGLNDPNVGSFLDFEVRVADIKVKSGEPHLINEKVIYKNERGHDPEPQDFRNNDTEVIMAEYFDLNSGTENKKDHYCVVKGVDIESGEVRLYIYEKGIHNECEGIFPNEEYICLESACDGGPGTRSVDLWKLKLDGSGERVRMTGMIDRLPWRATNSNVSPDGKWLAFMLNVSDSEAGYGMGIGLVDLQAWEKSEYSKQWETPESRAGKISQQYLDYLKSKNK